jgi:hypothetical protein
MARPTVNQIRGLGDFAHSNLWDIEIVGIDFVTDLDRGDINFRAQNVELPKRTGASLEINIRGQKIKQPGDYDYSGTTTITLIETDDLKISGAISKWREAIIETGTNNMTAKSDIEVQVIMRRLNRQGKSTGTWVLHGCYLEDYELGDMSDAGDLVYPTMTISYDYFEEQF